jgi:PIN domain nuclease of toxin-antitoxin system
MIETFACDTHALVWYAGGASRKLGRDVRKAFEAVDAGEATVYVPAAVVLETWHLALGRVIHPTTTLASWWREVERPNVILDPMSAEDVCAAADLDWDHADPMDRLIAVAALRLGVPLATADEAITRWGGVRVLW